MANVFGRQVVVPLTNKSGGSVAAGDVVIVDTTNNTAFTTTTTAADPKVTGVAQETIANNATGRVLTEGYAALVNVNASVTRGNFGKTHTVVKQATDAGSARIAGTFCRFLSGGTTPDAYVYPVDLAGAALTDPTTTRGDLITRDASALARLAVGASGKTLKSDGTDPSWQYPPGYEFDYASTTSFTTVTGANEGAANTVLSSNSVAYDGSTVVYIEGYLPEFYGPANIATDITVILVEDSTVLGIVGNLRSETANRGVGTLLFKVKRTPSNASHQYHIKAWRTTSDAGAGGGAGGSGNLVAAYIRVYKV